MALDVAVLQANIAQALPAIAEQAIRVRTGVANATLEFVRSSRPRRKELPASITDQLTVVLAAKTQEQPQRGDVLTFSLGTVLEIIDVRETPAGWRCLGMPSWPVRLRRTPKTAALRSQTGADAPAFISPNPRAVVLPQGHLAHGPFGELVSATPRGLVRPAWLTEAQIQELVRQADASWQLWTLTTGGLPTDDRDQPLLLDYAIRSARIHRDHLGVPMLLELEMAGGGA